MARTWPRRGSVTRSLSAAYGFDNTNNLVANVAGVGALTAVMDTKLGWGEYGVRVGYALNTATTFFADGVSGETNEIGIRVHGGAGLPFAF